MPSVNHQNINRKARNAAAKQAKKQKAEAKAEAAAAAAAAAVVGTKNAATIRHKERDRPVDDPISQYIEETPPGEKKSEWISAEYGAVGADTKRALQFSNR